MRSRWHGSILFRTGLILTLAFLFLGTVIILITLEYDRARIEQAANTRLSQLLDTVESTVSVACFARDETLATELADGLLKNSEVQAVIIRSNDEVLANRQVARQSINLTEAMTDKTREIHSPFNPSQVVGQIQLTPNYNFLREAVQKELQIVLVHMFSLLFFVGLAVSFAILFLILRPIQAISDGLHRMNPARGEKLILPTGHSASEIGLLVQDINALAECLMQTIDEEHELRVQREVDERRYHAIFDNAETGIFLLNTAGVLVSWNPACARLLALPEELNPQDNLSLIDLAWAEPERLIALIQHCVQTNSNTTSDLRYVLVSGGTWWLRIVLTPIGDQAIQGVLYDITEHKEAEASAKQLALTDNLTGLANRLGVEQRIREQALACDLGQSVGFGLFLIDFDEFKRVNDGFGLAIGDEILRQAANRLFACVKNSDLVARLGSNQFALLLANLQRNLDIERVAQRAFKILHEPFFVAGTPLKLQVSIGIAFYPQDVNHNAQILLQNADLALRQVKANGGNGMRFFAAELVAAAEQRKHLEIDLRAALRAEQFILFYQPIIDLNKNCLSGAEVLIRWRHPERGMVFPDAFIPLAEQTGLIIEIGAWTLEAAGRQLALWQIERRDLYLSINISGRQIPNDLPTKTLGEMSRRLGFNPAQLALEITEGVMLNDIAATQDWLKTVREQEFLVFLDDFGTGYSSLSYLKRFPVDRLKIDKSFIRDLPTDHNDRTLVKAIIAMAHSLGITVVAEGVETAEHVRLLREINCNYAQGYYFSKPVPIAEFNQIHEKIPVLLKNCDLNQ